MPALLVVLFIVAVAATVLVATGIRSIALDRLEMIAPELPLKKDSNGEGQKAVPAGTLRDFIRKLFTQDDLSTRVTGLIEHERALNPASSIEAASVDRIKTQYRRLQMEQNLAAMSLAAQLYRFEKSRWPASLADLLPYLPAKPTDFWGPLGYVLIRGDGPDQTGRTDPRAAGVTTDVRTVPLPGATDVAADDDEAGDGDATRLAAPAAAAGLAALAGAPGPTRDSLVLAAATVLHAFGRFGSPGAAADAARRALDTGAARERFARASV